jgi:hypothetical protein
MEESRTCKETSDTPQQRGRESKKRAAALRGCSFFKISKVDYWTAGFAAPVSAFGSSFVVGALLVVAGAAASAGFSVFMVSPAGAAPVSAAGFTAGAAASGAGAASLDVTASDVVAGLSAACSWAISRPQEHMPRTTTTAMIQLLTISSSFPKFDEMSVHCDGTTVGGKYTSPSPAVSKKILSPEKKNMPRGGRA